MSMNKQQIRESLRNGLLESESKEISAGVLIMCTKTNKVLLLLRSSEGRNGNTWSLLSGGIEDGETPLEGLKREVTEEISINPDIIDYKFINKIDTGDSSKEFHYYEGFTSSQFIPKLDHENTDYKWVSKDELPSPLYPKLKEKLDNIWKSQI